jgi:hypothetical protein
MESGLGLPYNWPGLVYGHKQPWLAGIHVIPPAGDLHISGFCSNLSVEQHRHPPLLPESIQKQTDQRSISLIPEGGTIAI